jgi:general secretion pathway protein C
LQQLVTVKDISTVKDIATVKLNKLPHWSLNLLLVGFVIYGASLLAQLTWILISDDQDGFSGGVSWSPGVAVRGANSARDVSVLLTISLFGKEGVSAPTQQLMERVEAPKTRLQLQLKGVFISERDSESSAIVSEKGKTGEYFKVGDKLPGNAELVAVYSDRVLLKRNGRLETLSFDGGSKSNNLIAKVKSASKGRQVNSPEQFVSVAEKRIAENPTTALASVGLKPVSEGKADGYVYDGKNPMLARMNLKPGDVVRSVNGFPLGDINKDKALLKQLYEQGSLEVEVERNGTSFYINYPLH